MVRTNGSESERVGLAEHRGGRWLPHHHAGLDADAAALVGSLAAGWASPIAGIFEDYAGNLREPGTAWTAGAVQIVD